MTCNKLRIIKFSFLIVIEIILIATIIFLGRKILISYQDNVKGMQIVKIDKKYLDFSQVNTENRQLKYFYEPKTDSVETWNPEWLGYEVKNMINKDSLNERYDYTVGKEKDTYRIITLGDSFTFGMYVKTADNYSEILEDMLNKQLECNGITRFDVINLGVYGYDLEYTVERFMKRGIKYDPDLVILLINEWTITDINEVILPERLEIEENGIPNTKWRNNEIVYYSWELAKNKLYRNITNADILKYRLNNLIRLKSYSGNFLLFSLSPLSQYDNFISDFVSHNSNYNFYNKLVPTYWKYSIFRLSDNHPSELGHKIIAQNIISYLTNTYLDNCKVSHLDPFLK